MRNCIECGIAVKYTCKKKCNKCYQRGKSQIRKLLKPPKIVVDNCLVCDRKEGDLNANGKCLVKKLVKGYCELCYYKTFKKLKVRNCKSCGVEFKGIKVSELCTLCKGEINKKSKINKIPTRRELDPQLYQDMLTLFRRYRDGLNTPVDAFRVIDVYLRVFEGYPFVYNSQIDTYSEESQIVMMLKNMKRVYDNV